MVYPREATTGFLDFLLASEEEQDVARRLAKMDLQDGADRRLQIGALRLRGVEDLDRGQATRNRL